VELHTAPAGESFTTYNIEVEEDHTYHVGELGTWVHNKSKEVCLQLARRAAQGDDSALNELRQVLAEEPDHRKLLEKDFKKLLEKIDAPTTSPRPKFRNCNDFQAGTKGQFSSRADAAKAWEAYKDANGIVTGTVRSQAAKQRFLRSLADDPNTPSWMKPWLRVGRVPPGYDVDHIKPLSIGGPDTPANMRLQGTDLHRTHHKYYPPWEW